MNDNDRLDRPQTDLETPQATARAEADQIPNENEEADREPWRVKDSPMQGFWRPALILLVLGVLAMLLARALF